MFKAAVFGSGRESVADKFIDPQQDALFVRLMMTCGTSTSPGYGSGTGGMSLRYLVRSLFLLPLGRLGKGGSLHQGWMMHWLLRKLSSLVLLPLRDFQSRSVCLSRDVALRASAGHGALARLHAAADLAHSGRTEEAIALWHDLRDGPNVDPIVRDMARFLAVQNAADLPAADLSALEADLDP